MIEARTPAARPSGCRNREEDVVSQYVRLCAGTCWVSSTDKCHLQENGELWSRGQFRIKGYGFSLVNVSLRYTRTTQENYPFDRNSELECRQRSISEVKFQSRF